MVPSSKENRVIKSSSCCRNSVSLRAIHGLPVIQFCSAETGRVLACSSLRMWVFLVMASSKQDFISYIYGGMYSVSA